MMKLFRILIGIITTNKGTRLSWRKALLRWVIKQLLPRLLQFDMQGHSRSLARFGIDV
jgi:hypothetical protein